ncbi:pyridoxamine 5'-phosphate oxidase family protein [uncultured Desulfovibrio sp.]|uniref:pyridoxamine 5'-phosphate oxidase family protein n=1 Tax=uncultured Desulfovibrio sp. TaxID=167968 RepID=UPI002805433E|nr:pyridoxamine 5'-phosphate oxidase family protein [uncultured Desulfovibrio sp.]
MRRKDRERTDDGFFDALFSAAEVLFLAFRNGDFPYCLPVNFAREGDHLYIHCAPEGLKLDCARRDDRVAFSCAADIVIDRERSSTYYSSLCGTGRAVIVDAMEEKRHALDRIGERYAARCPRPTPEATARRVTILRIDIRTLTGKQCKAAAD